MKKTGTYTIYIPSKLHAQIMEFRKKNPKPGGIAMPMSTFLQLAAESFLAAHELQGAKSEH